MEKSSFFNAEIINGEYDRTYLAEDYANYFSSFIGNGVFPNPSNNLKVVANGDNMKITVKQGKAWINGYYYENDDELILNLIPADGVLNRIDRVVVRFDLLEREISIKVKQGLFASNPIAADLERNTDIYELAIADIKIQNGVISINNSNITDLRLNSELCGLVHGTVEQVDTTEIFNSYQHYLNEKINSNEFNEWFISLKNKLNPYEDVALQLQVQITELEEKMENSLKTDGTLQENLNADMIDGKHATGTLVTNEKNNLVTAINEVFTNADNGKKAIASAIIGKGGNVNDSMTFVQLAGAIGGLDTSCKALSGTYSVNVPQLTYSSSSSSKNYLWAWESVVDLRTLFPQENLKFVYLYYPKKYISSTLYYTSNTTYFWFNVNNLHIVGEHDSQYNGSYPRRFTSATTGSPLTSITLGKAGYSSSKSDIPTTGATLTLKWVAFYSKDNL